MIGEGKNALNSYPATSALLACHHALTLHMYSTYNAVLGGEGGGKVGRTRYTAGLPPQLSWHAIKFWLCTCTAPVTCSLAVRVELGE